MDADAGRAVYVEYFRLEAYDRTANCMEVDDTVCDASDWKMDLPDPKTYRDVTSSSCLSFLHRCSATSTGSESRNASLSDWPSWRTAASMALRHRTWPVSFSVSRTLKVGSGSGLHPKRHLTVPATNRATIGDRACFQSLRHAPGAVYRPR